MCEETSLKPYFPNDVAQELLAYAKNQFDRKEQNVHLISNNKEANDMLDPLGQYPHAFVLACIMDIQVKAENAWMIPYYVKKSVHSFDMAALCHLSEEEIKIIFSNMEKAHRFPTQMAKRFYDAVQKIHVDYNDNASNLWADNPSSGLLIYRFMQFKGVGIKIATMATNILVRQFGVKLADNSSIDISPDVHTVRVFQRLGLTSFDKKENQLKRTQGTIYMARAINPEYPGIFDYPCWSVGAKHCHPQSPDCEACPFRTFCKTAEG